jgi:hypothetical protein
MGKTSDDEEYERGVRDGQREGFFGDFIQGQTKTGSPYDKGYEYGATHRYGPEGPYHTWDNRGSNDPKTKDDESYSEVEAKNYSDPSFYYRDNDRSYTWEQAADTEPRYWPNRLIWVLGLIGIFVFIGAFIGAIKEHKEKEILKKETQVAKKYNQNEMHLLRRLKWKVPQAPALKPWESYDGSDAIRDFDNPYRNVKTTIQTEEGLKNLARLIRKNKGWCVTINDYAQVDDDIWAVGIYSNVGGGFICYSSDHGDTWFRQWYSEAWNESNNFQADAYEVPLRIHFFDSKEGWSFTRRKILYTHDGGRTWKSTCGGSSWFLRQLHIIDRQNLVAEDISTGKYGSRMIYTSDGGKNWKIYAEWKPEILGLEAKLENPNGSGLFVYNK